MYFTPLYIENASIRLQTRFMFSANGWLEQQPSLLPTCLGWSCTGKGLPLQFNKKGTRQKKKKSFLMSGVPLRCSQFKNKMQFPAHVFNTAAISG